MHVKLPWEKSNYKYPVALSWNPTTTTTGMSYSVASFKHCLNFVGFFFLGATLRAGQTDWPLIKTLYGEAVGWKDFQTPQLAKKQFPSLVVSGEFLPREKIIHSIQVKALGHLKSNPSCHQVHGRSSFLSPRFPGIQIFTHHAWSCELEGLIFVKFRGFKSVRVSRPLTFFEYTPED